MSYLQSLRNISNDVCFFQTLLIWSCSGIALGLTILGIYCDPHLRMHSWYLHRLWPLRRYNYKEKNIRERLDTYENYSLYNHTVSPFINDSGKSWYRVSENENTTDVDWSVKFEPKEKEEITIWLPVILLSMVLFLYNIGLGSVPYVLISELFAVNVSMEFINFIYLRYKNIV